MEAWQDAAVLAGVVFAVLALAVAIQVLRRVGQLSRAAEFAEIASDLRRIDAAQTRLERAVREDFAAARHENATAGAGLRREVLAGIDTLSQNVLRQATALAGQQKESLETFATQLRRSAGDTAQQLKENHEALIAGVRDVRGETVRQLDAAKTEAVANAKLLSEQVGTSLAEFGRTTRDQTSQILEIQKAQHRDLEARFSQLREGNDKAGEALRTKLEEQLVGLRRENEAKLEAMRATVDEKLQGTLEKRLGESFQIVSERLEAVHKGLGEMQTLAIGVGDLKRVLTNVKQRGGWGEVQLGALLEHALAPSQFASNVAPRADSGERVEFAIRLPGQEDGVEVLLPIDAKFPMEDYQRLQEAHEAADHAMVAEEARKLELRIRACAKDIRTKYIHPPQTTDFAIMFLPTEGLYAEVIRRPGLCDDLQREHRVTVAGPTTLTALLNSLQMGFRTLAIQQRSSEVWQVLGAVKSEFGKFGPVLEKVKKKLQEASNTIDQANTRQRAIDRKLRDVEALPAVQATALIGTLEAEIGAEGLAEAGLHAAE